MSYPQGTILKLSLDPSMGHEQKGYRPVMVLQRQEVSDIISVTFVVPITTSARRLPFEVPLPDGMQTKGWLLCRQMRALDLSKRPHTVVETVPPETIRQCVRCVNAMIEAERK